MSTRNRRFASQISSPRLQLTLPNSNSRIGVPEWQTVAIKGKLNLLVARISARVFLGPELCRNPVWLRIAVSHIMTGFMAALSLRMFPGFLRPLVTWVLPPCRSLRSQVQQARNLIRPVIERRKEEKAAAVLRGDKPVQYNDGIEWADMYANGRTFDRVDLQLGLSIAAVHNTTDLLAQVVYDLANDPEMVERLRVEATQVLVQGGWSKTTLYNLKLLDSVIKESQRIKPILTGKSDTTGHRISSHHIRMVRNMLIELLQWLCRVRPPLTSRWLTALSYPKEHCLLCRRRSTGTLMSTTNQKGSLVTAF